MSPPLTKIPWYKRLRWRLIGPQFLVVFVGVGIMMLAMWLILRAAPAVIRPHLANLVANPERLAEIEAELLVALRNAVLLSVLVAATLALIAGVVSAITLWRTIIVPLYQIAHSSRRVADGRYSERVAVPTSSGEAMAQLAASFNQMALALEQVEQQRVALLANISHELRTPLTGLKGYLEGLIDGLFPAEDETFAWMSQEVERLQRLVDDIQNLSRIEAGQFALDFQDFELTAVVKRVVAELQPQARRKAIELRIRTAEAPVYVHADADRTIQILINLINNAIRYTPDHGRVAVSVHAGREDVHISVQDTGIGIPAGALPYVFERFYRVDRSRARTSGGSGIGLTIARHLAWAMGGKLTAASEGADKGSTFTFTLPPAERA